MSTGGVSRGGARPINPAHPADALLLGFKRHLRRALEAHDVDQVDLASEALVDASMVSRWCSSRARDVPGPQHLALVAVRYPLLVASLTSWLAEHAGHRVVPRAGDGGTRSIAELVAAQHAATADVVQASFEAGVGRGTSIADLSDEQLDRLDRTNSDVESAARETRCLVDIERSKRDRARGVVSLSRARAAATG